MRDADDLHVLQTAERGAADVLCTNDKDFHDDPAVLGYCAARGIEVCYENDLLTRLVGGLISAASTSSRSRESWDFASSTFTCIRPG